MSRSALVIDDDGLSRDFLAEALGGQGFRVLTSADGEEGIRLALSGEPELVLTDLRLPGTDGLGVIRVLRERLPGVAIVMLTAYGTVECAVEAMRLGAEDFLLKPVSPEQLEIVLGRLERSRRLARENEVLKARLDDAPGADRGPGLIGRNRRFREAIRLAERVAPTDATVLIRGESGTGKELVAEILHRRSRRAEGPFIRVNCAALAESLLASELFGHEKGAFTGADSRKEGRFELAEGGTLFLDEIGEVSLEVQAKLLRVLETGEFERVGGTRTITADARVVTATNRDLEEAMQRGAFRADLFYRLDVVPIHLPPLRERLDDLEPLAEHLVARFRRLHGGPARELSRAALAALRCADWPGNVRELANVLQRAVLVAQGPVIEADHLGLPGRRPRREQALPVGATLEEVERRLILETLEVTDWNRSEAARILGVTARTLSNKIKLWKVRGLLAVEEDT